MLHLSAPKGYAEAVAWVPHAHTHTWVVLERRRVRAPVRGRSATQFSAPATPSTRGWRGPPPCLASGPPVARTTRGAPARSGPPPRRASHHASLQHRFFVQTSATPRLPEVGARTHGGGAWVRKPAVLSTCRRTLAHAAMAAQKLQQRRRPRRRSTPSRRPHVRARRGVAHGGRH